MRSAPVPQRDVAALRIDLLKTAIADIQGSIHANDSKCSAALVVHGLLFAGVVTVASRLGETWTAAGGPTQDASTALLAIATVAFVLSISSLLYALIPYSPRKTFYGPIVDAHRLRGVFFPNLKSLRASGADVLTPYLASLAALDSSEKIELELAYELIKVQNIRQHQAFWAICGFGLLIVEVAFAACFLVIMGLSAT